MMIKIAAVLLGMASAGELRGRFNEPSIQLVDSQASAGELRFGGRRDKTEADEEHHFSEDEVVEGDRGVDDCGDCYLFENCIQNLFNWFCRCEEGFERNGDTCVDINECAEADLNECSHGCKNLDGGYECTCPSGYHMGHDGHHCEDINECKEGYCASPCINYPGGYVCACELGYGSHERGQGVEQMDEYAEIAFGSAIVAESKKSPLPYQFADRAREEAHNLGLHCEDINECDELVGVCPTASICTNTIGSFECDCDDGFHVPEYSDEDEHHDEPAGGHHRRLASSGHDDHGSDGGSVYDPDIPYSFHGPVSPQATWFMNWMAAIAENKVGHVLMVLGNGFVYDAAMSCVDINECEDGDAEGKDPCGDKRFEPCCANTEGSFECLEKTKSGRRGKCPAGTTEWLA